MGACGCGDYYPEFKTEEQNGVVYTIQKYKSCDYCQTPSGVIVQKHDVADDDFFLLEGIPLLEFEKEFDNSAVLEIFDPYKFKKEFMELIQLAVKEEGSLDQFDIEDIFDETLREF